MDRKDKIKLLQDLQAGKKGLADLRGNALDLSKLTVLELFILRDIVRKYGPVMRLDDLPNESMLPDERQALCMINEALSTRPAEYKDMRGSSDAYYLPLEEKLQYYLTAATSEVS
jgi:hypothetical protein